MIAVGEDLACTREPELFFAEAPADVEVAKALCVECPVRTACLEGALERREPWGVWGGELLLRGAVVPRRKQSVPADLGSARQLAPGSKAAVNRDASPDRMSRRALQLGALLLPRLARDRYIEEWWGELATLQTRLGRCRFAVSLLFGMPSMAVELRRRSRRRPA
jgi:WhiB family transcriptional regulator, redox-sensing transcriptional regulator